VGLTIEVPRSTGHGDVGNAPTFGPARRWRSSIPYRISHCRSGLVPTARRSRLSSWQSRWFAAAANTWHTIAEPSAHERSCGRCVSGCRWGAGATRKNNRLGECGAPRVASLIAMVGVGLPSISCRAGLGTRRGWRAFAHHDGIKRRRPIEVVILMHSLAAVARRPPEASSGDIEAFSVALRGSPISYHVNRTRYAVARCIERPAKRGNQPFSSIAVRAQPAGQLRAKNPWPDIHSTVEWRDSGSDTTTVSNVPGHSHRRGISAPICAWNGIQSGRPTGRDERIGGLTG
jgi:hypothetical protein